MRVKGTAVILSINAFVLVKFAKRFEYAVLSTLAGHRTKPLTQKIKIDVDIFLTKRDEITTPLCTLSKNNYSRFTLHWIPTVTVLVPVAEGRVSDRRIAEELLEE